MKSHRHLSKLGGVGKSWIDGTESRSTANDGLTGMDIAAAMGMANLSRAQSLLIYRDYALDYSVQSELYYALEVECMSYAVEGNWKFPTGARLMRRMVKLAVAETVYPMRCFTCHGVGELSTGINRKSLPCEPCGGTGRAILRDKDRAEILNIQPETFSRTWRAPYQKLTEHMARIGEQALRKIDRRL